MAEQFTVFRLQFRRKLFNVSIQNGPAPFALIGMLTNVCRSFRRGNTGSHVLQCRFIGASRIWFFTHGKTPQRSKINPSQIKRSFPANGAIKEMQFDPSVLVPKVIGLLQIAFQLSILCMTGLIHRTLFSSVVIT
ncbi:MAG TPA: hypothetical protein VFK06_05605 [Candidatus Angelobacter sp.]|nr:hypothetical protein [Candidatus Angelobacter sp.]